MRERAAESERVSPNQVRGDCKQAGIVDTPENLWEFFVEKSRRFLHLCLCFSPVSS